MKNTSLYTSIEQLFKLEDLLEKCILNQKQNLPVYTIKVENIKTTKQRSQFIGLDFFAA